MPSCAVDRCLFSYVGQAPEMAYHLLVRFWRAFPTCRVVAESGAQSVNELENLFLNIFGSDSLFRQCPKSFGSQRLSQGTKRNRI